MRPPRPRARPAAASSGGLPEAGVSSAVRRAFNAALHPRDGNGRFRQTDNPQQQAPRRSRTASGEGEAPARRPTVGEQALKTSGVSGNDTIQVLSSRVRKYQGFTTVESFVAGHPKGRAYALRTLAADQKAGRIGFVAAEGSAKPAAKAPKAEAPKEKITARDETEPSTLPEKGTPEAKFHESMARAANVFGDRARMRIAYDKGKPRGIQIDVMNAADDEEIGVISRSFDTFNDGRKVVTHDLFMLDDKLQGAGQAKKFLARSIEAYKHLGIDTVRVHANIDVGGYAWIKYGFKPDQHGAKALTDHANEKIDALHSTGAIDDALAGHLRRNVAFGDFEQVVELGDAKVSFNGKTQSVGKHIFLGSDWTGELDLHSRSSMATFHDYVSKQK